MNFNSPEILTLKSNLDGCINSAIQHQPNSYVAIKVGIARHNCLRHDM